VPIAVRTVRGRAGFERQAVAGGAPRSNAPAFFSESGATVVYFELAGFHLRARDARSAAVNNVSARRSHEQATGGREVSEVQE
jgi:hypothetical protein